MGSKKKEVVNQKEEHRRQAALAAAEQCAALLKEQFGAQRVIPFGSVTGGSPWHPKSDEEPDEFATRALSTYLDDFYKGCERICERVAVMLDGHLPQGDRWHQKLLGQMGETGGQDRPPLFGGQLLLELDEYRRFRHRVRHLYGYALDPHRVRDLAENVPPVFNRVQEAVESFNRWLSQNGELS